MVVRRCRILLKCIVHAKVEIRGFLVANGMVYRAYAEGENISTLLKNPIHLPTTQAIQESRLSSSRLSKLLDAGIVTVHPSRVHGAIVFAGTRVPIYNLWDYLAGGDSPEDFLESFSTVSQEQVKLVQETVHS